MSFVNAAKGFSKYGLENLDTFAKGNPEAAIGPLDRGGIYAHSGLLALSGTSYTNSIAAGAAAGALYGGAQGGLSYDGSILGGAFSGAMTGGMLGGMARGASSLYAQGAIKAGTAKMTEGVAVPHFEFTPGNTKSFQVSNFTNWM